MKTVDERVVEMQFDNKQFESGIKTSLNSLENLKKGLNFNSATKSITELQNAGNRFSLANMGKSLDLIASRFTNMGIVGMTALQNVTNAAVNAGARMLKALSLDPVMTGFNEYETKINAITTILTNTKSKGTTLDDVTSALNELNEYADKTIYNFAEMTRNIGTFTAAGVDLDSSVKAIKGIANLAAGSGSTAVQASSAMYQLSQALAAGRVSLQDWNSVVNAGMGGELFQNALKETAKQMGIVVDESVSFRESISATGGKESWLTSDVLIKTLEKFAEDETLVKAATQVKTFTQLMDTMKESVQSGWAQSWEYIIGDRDQAAELFTSISDGFNSIIQPSVDARNAALKFWNEAGGRKDVIQGLSNVISTFGKILSPIGEAFDETFTPITGERLVSISKSFLDLTEKFKISDNAANNIKNTFKGLFAVIDMFGKGVKAIVSPFFDLSGGLTSIAGSLLEASGSFGMFLVELNESSSTEEVLNKLSSSLSKGTTAISNFISSIFSGSGEINSFLKTFASGVTDFAGSIFTNFTKIFGWLTDNISIGDIFAGLAGGGIFVVAKKLSGFIDSIKESFENLFGAKDKLDDAKKTFSDVLSSVHDSLNAFTAGIKTASLLIIASSILILTAAINSLSKIKATSITKSLMAIGFIMAELNLSLKSISKTLKQYDAKGLLKTSVSLIAIATAINIMSSSVEKISKINTEDLIKGLSGLAVVLAELSLFLKATKLEKTSLKGSVALIVIAGAITILAGALEQFGSMSWGEIGKGLTTLGVALLELSLAIKIMNNSKISVSTSIAIVALAESCKILAEALDMFGSLSLEKIAKGLTTMGLALAELVISITLLNKVGGGKSLLGSGAIFIITQSLDEIAVTLKDLGSMSWEEIGKGLAAMGGALLELSLVSGTLGKIAGFSGILGSGAILIGVQALKPISVALKEIGSLSWEQIQKGLTGMGIALLEVSVIVGLLGKLTGLSGILGAGAILIGVQSLGKLAEALDKFGSMSWEEIQKGLVGMGLALAELALVAGLLGSLSPLSILGSGSLLLGVQSLKPIADTMKDLSAMSWDEIGRSLGAMAGAFGAMALGGLINTLSGFGASAISEMAPALGVLADSIKKWKGVTVPENLGSQLGSLASGVMKFTFGGFGASALTSAAPGIGALADAIKKWQYVTIPEGLEKGLKEISNGVKEFTFAFAGGWSISQIIDPLSNLPGAIKKWSDVYIPTNIGTGLKDLADGVGAFTWKFAAGWSLGEIVGPLGKLADSVKKWNGIFIPTGIGTKLIDLAKGLDSFSSVNISEKYLNGISDGILEIAKASNSLSYVKFSTITSGINSIKTAISSLSSQVSSQSSRIVSSFNNLINGSLNAIKSKTSQFSSQGKNLANSFSNSLTSGLRNSSGSLNSTATTVLNSLITSMTRIISNNRTKFQNEGSQLMTYLGKGLKSNNPQITSSITSALSSAASRASGYRNSFYNAALNCAYGLSSGIRDGKSSVINAAVYVAASGLNAAKNRLGIHSPSREFEWLGEQSDNGLIKGFYNLAGKVGNSAKNVGNVALSAMEYSLDKINKILTSDSSLIPRITPVIDTTSIASNVDNLKTITLGKMSDLTTSTKSLLNSDDRLASAINQYTNGMMSLKNDMSKLFGSLPTNVMNEVKVLIGDEEFDAYIVETSQRGIANNQENIRNARGV